MASERDEHQTFNATAPFRFLGQALAGLRWLIILAMLLVTLLWPVPGRTAGWSAPDQNAIRE
jgi:predicted ABC-type sugar transport system permease subunit